MAQLQQRLQRAQDSGGVSRRDAVPAVLLAARIGLAGLLAGNASHAQQVPAVADRLNVREVELVLEPPPVRKGLSDMRLGDFEPTDTAVGPGFHVKVPARKGLADLVPGDVLLVEGGRARPVLRVEPLASGGGNPWTLRIYFDLVLARPDTVFEAALALAGQAAQLAKLGTVEVIVADPAPHTVLERSREAPAIVEALAALAGQASRDPQARPGSRIPPPTPVDVRRQCDRLVTHLVDAAPAGPHALLLIADSPSMAPAELQLLSTVSTPASARTPTRGSAQKAAAAAISGPSRALVLGETARLLAAYGWVTLALPIHRLTGSPEEAPGDASTRSTERSQESLHPPAGVPVISLIVALVRWIRGKHPQPVRDMRLVAPQLDMENAPLVAMVRPTAGTVIAYRETLGPALGALAARWHLWYQGDASPAGRELPIAVSLLGSGQDWRSPRWVRSSTPEDLAAARLRRALDGDGGRGSLPVSVTWLRAPMTGRTNDGTALRPAAEPVPAAEPASAAEPAPAAEAAPATATGSAAEEAGVTAAPGPLLELAVATPLDVRDPSTSGPLRLSFAWADTAGNARVTHQLLDGAATALWNGKHRLRLAAPPSPPGHNDLAVLIEDLGSELWGAAVVARPLPPPPGQRRSTRARGGERYDGLTLPGRRRGEFHRP